MWPTLSQNGRQKADVILIFISNGFLKSHSCDVSRSIYSLHMSNHQNKSLDDSWLQWTKQTHKWSI